MRNSDQSAYPVESKSAISENYHGLTKREYFAGLAMQGLLAHERSGNNNDAKLAEMAVSQADALLYELEKQNQ